MNPILEMLMNSAGGSATQRVGQQFGLSDDQTNSALSQLVPALMAGIQRNTSQAGGMDALLGALTSGNHAQYLDRPEMLGRAAATEDGNSILGHIFGSKDVSRAVAGRASEETGISADILKKKMLPVVATMVMGSLSKKKVTAAATAPATAGGGFLSSLLDQNQDGSIADDVTGMLGRFLGGR